MKALTFTLVLREPVLIAQTLDGDPNSAVSYGYIPGSTLRGALARRYQIQKKLENMAMDLEARHLFFNKEFYFLNAYPVLPDGEERMLPAPRTWFSEKDKRKDDEVIIEDASWVNETCLKRPERLSDEFVLPGGDSTYRFSAHREISIHNASDNRRRKKAGESQVFRYEALSAGQRFLGVILPASVEQEIFLQELKALLESSVLIGGSHTGGYGLADIERSVIREWQEYSPEDSLNRISITLLSDVILPPAQPKEEPILTFAHLLGLKRTDEFEAIYWQPRLVGGFNRTWGLPLPQHWAISAGSVFVLPAERAQSADLQDLVAAGIGIRREDGFGRIAVNLYAQEKRKLEAVKLQNVTKPTRVSKQANVIAKKIANHLLRQRLEDALVLSLSSPKLSFSNLPSKTQLNRLRVAARHTMLSGNTNAIKAYLNNMKLSKPYWSNARLNGQKLDEWVLECAETNSMEQLLHILGQPSEVPEIGNQKADDPELIPEFTARYIDSVMKLAVRSLPGQDGDVE